MHMASTYLKKGALPAIKVAWGPFWEAELGGWKKMYE